jgi:hypothetical protein
MVEAVKDGQNDGLMRLHSNAARFEIETAALTS